MKDLKLCGRTPAQGSITVQIGECAVGRDLALIAGPCSIESEAQIIATALGVKEAGAIALRGGAFKPRTSPYAFQGLGLEGLKYLRQAGKEADLPVVTEVIDSRDAAWVAEYADVLQIGARNMQNFTLLQEVGKTGKPVLLKRGMHSHIEEWLNCAEYILAEGNEQVILCERGIRTFETETRNTLDLSAVAVAKIAARLPVIIDPSHAAGRRDLIEPLTLAAVALGADGCIIEAHNNPAEAKCDGAQSLTPPEFAAIAKKARALRQSMETIHARN